MAVALCGIAVMWASFQSVNRTEMDAPILCGVAAFCLSWAFSVSPQMSAYGFHVGQYGAQPFYGAIAVASVVLAFYAANASEWKEGPALCCAVVAIATATACFIEKAWACPPPFHLLTGDRAVGTIGSPVFMGTVIAVTVPVCAWMASKESEHWRLGTVGVLCGLFSMAASGSRGPFLASGIGMAGYYLAAGHIVPTRKSISVLCAITAIAIVVLAINLRTYDMARFEVWGIALDGGFRYPVLGWGPDTFFILNISKKAAGEVQASAHNDILQMWATMGAVGLAAYLWAWLAAFRIAYKFPPVFGSLVALFVAAKFNPVPPSAMILAAALLGSVAVAVKPSKFLWEAGVVLLLIAPGISISRVIDDGRETVHARIR